MLANEYISSYFAQRTLTSVVAIVVIMLKICSSSAETGAQWSMLTTMAATARECTLIAV